MSIYKQFVGGGQTGNPQMPAWEIDQSYDGVNQPLKRIETRRIETLVGGGPQTTITTVTETTLYVRSSLLGGQIVYELDESGNRRRANIYGIGGLLARGAISSGTDEFRWRVGDPVTGNWGDTSNAGGYVDTAQIDPLGAEVGSSDPYLLNPDPTYPEMKDDEPLYIEGGDPFDLSGGCTLDGMPVPCGFGWRTAQVGASVAFSGSTQTSFWHDGRYYYLGVGVHGNIRYEPQGSREGFGAGAYIGAHRGVNPGMQNHLENGWTDADDNSGDGQVSQNPDIPPCGINPVTGKPGFTDNPKGTPGHLRPGGGGNGFWNARRPRHRDGDGHDGLDISASYARSQIVAYLGGVVIESRNSGSFGHTIVVDHGNGLKSRYAHLTVKYVSRGTYVSRGQKIGLAGISGNWRTEHHMYPGDVHLHFEIHRNGRDVNPVPYLNSPCWLRYLNVFFRF